MGKIIFKGAVQIKQEESSTTALVSFLEWSTTPILERHVDMFIIDSSNVTALLFLNFLEDPAYPIDRGAVIRLIVKFLRANLIEEGNDYS